MKTEREQILALAKRCGMHGMITDVVTTTDELEAFFNAARKPLEDDLYATNARLAGYIGEADELRQQLAAAQAREHQYREALHYSLGAWHYDGVSDEHGSIFEEANNRCDQPQDTSALQAMIQKAGEVMRERCANGCDILPCEWSHEEREIERCVMAIRALPGVTLEDLK